MLKEISNRMGIVLGIVMFFYIIFSLIQMLINPDKVNDKEKGAINIVKKVIIVIVLLAVHTSCFEILFQI